MLRALPRPQPCGLALLLLSCLTPAAAVSAPASSVFSISIGYNRSFDPTLPQLKYADDDAIRSDQLMRALGAQSVLLAELDRESQALYPGSTPAPPTLGAVKAAFAALNQRIDVARQQGKETTLYFFYTGHGNVHHGEGYVQLADGRLTRSTLLGLLRASRAQFNHVVIDACKSYFLVFERGPGGKRRTAAGPFLPGPAAIPAHTGFLLSTSSATDSHEWEAFQAGIFSHEVRSALRGAADLDRNNVVTYEEAAGFIYTANKNIPNQRYRPQFYVHPPTGALSQKAILSDLRAAAGRQVVFDLNRKAHYFIESAAGVRLADLHLGDRPLAVLVPRGEKLFVREAHSSREYMLPAQQRIALSELSARQATAQPRGAEHESFRLLFNAPYDTSAMLAYRQRPAEEVDDGPPARLADWLQPTLGIGALVILASGGVLTGLAARECAGVDEHTSNLDSQAVNRSISSYNTGALVCYLAGAAAAAGYLAWTFWPEKQVSVTVNPSTRGGQINLWTSW